MNRVEYQAQVCNRLLAQGFVGNVAPPELEGLTTIFTRQESWGWLALAMAPFETDPQQRSELVLRASDWARSQSEGAGPYHFILPFPSDVRVDPDQSAAILALKRADIAGGRWSVLPWAADVAMGLVDQHSGFPKVDPAIVMVIAEPPTSSLIERPKLGLSQPPRVAQRVLQMDRVPVTRVILAATIAYYVWVSLVDPSGFSLMRGPGILALLQWGANHGQLVLVEGQTWRLLTHILMHGGLMHLGFNMWALWWLGRYVELLYGSWRMAIIYLAAGVAGGLASTVLRPTFVPSVGASGAVLGLMGALLYFALAMPGKRMDWRELIVPVAINLLYGLFLPGIIDNYAHFGGFGAGLITAALVGIPGQRSIWRTYSTAAVLVVLVLTLTGAMPLAHMPLFR